MMNTNIADLAKNNCYAFFVVFPENEKQVFVPILSDQSVSETLQEIVDAYPGCKVRCFEHTYFGKAFDVLWSPWLGYIAKHPIFIRLYILFGMLWKRR